MLAQENATEEIVWQIEHCGWTVKIATEKDTLYPGLTSPVSHTDYNVTITPDRCESGESDVNTTVILSIVFNENVLKIVDTIYCIVYMEHMYSVNRTSYMNSTDLATIPPTTTMISESTVYSTSMDSMEATTDSGCRLCVHLSSLSLCLLVATLFAFSLISCH